MKEKKKGLNLSPPQVITKSLNPVHCTTYIRFSHDKEIKSSHSITINLQSLSIEQFSIE